MTSAIKLDQVSKRFGKAEVLQNVSLAVPSGTVFALLGENGAGKSTLIRGLLGYHKFNSGTAEILGLDPARRPLEVRRKVGYVADAPGLYEWMTVSQAGWYAAGFYPDGYLQRYDRITHEFSLRPDAKIRDLSKGMRAKVALALAISFDPELLVLDEPTSGLDPLVRRSFLESMIDRAASGKTVFISSHQIHEVERIADWVAILHEGKLQVAASLDELKEQVSMLSFSLRDPLLAPPLALDQLQILHQSQQGRTVTCMVRGCDSGILSSLQAEGNLHEVKIVRPSLEELYIGFTQPISANPAFVREQDSQIEVA
jgi:ABC-2 type transport system ATP-binding protein